MPAVVSIEAFAEVNERGGLFLPGSGFIIDESGYIVTNHHNIAHLAGRKEKTLEVILASGERLPAEVVSSDEATDLAILKINDGGKTFPIVMFGDSDAVEVGDWVIAIGNPFEEENSVTAGIISAKNRHHKDSPIGYLQTDAVTNFGNSGGPLFNLTGEVIGVNDHIKALEGEMGGKKLSIEGNIGMGFAIPSNSAKFVVDELRKYGRFRQGWFGAKIETALQTTEGARTKLGVPAGVYVHEINKGSPADRGGLRSGDTIISWNGKKMRTFEELRSAFIFSGVGTTARAVVLREKKELKLSIPIRELEESD